MKRRLHPGLIAVSALPAALLLGCGGSDAPLPQLGAATPATLTSCADLVSTLALANTTITSAVAVAEGGLTATGVSTPIPAHCLVKGSMNPRTSAVDGASYAIGFEMRLPVAWNGRFYYQANGGLDGSVVTALGSVSGGAPISPALSQGFAVLSSNAGHAVPSPFFGLDPQARLDYGYTAVASLTPMAKNLIKAAYGKTPDRSYFAGCSNGGRHAMVAAARYGDQYDGILAGNPGFHLPKAATAQLWKAQQYATVATLDSSSQPDLTTAVTPAEFKTVSSAIIAKCDALDGVVDNQVQDVAACQAAFNLQTDVPTCSGARDGTCLSAAQKTVLAKVFAGPKNNAGTALYSDTWFDPGIAGSNFASWHFSSPATRDAGAVAFIFTTPPSTVAAFAATTGLQYALNFNMETDYPKIFATNSTYTESAWSFMTPPNEADLGTLKNRGAKMVVYHGIADGVFSPVDTARWYDAVKAKNGGDASNFARLFLVPGMNHCSGGLATDQFDMLAPLVKWVEQGTAPASITANARGAGANVVNTELPTSWSANRSRPLCPYPQVARYNGSGDVESAASFSCR
jgi:pimeloyl-ACP methyl ester carboxylesterase